MHRLLAIAAAGLAALVASGPAGAWSWPADGDVLRSFALGGDAYAAGQHRGVDVAGAEGSSVRSPVSGTVSFAGTLPTYGRGVTILTADGYAVTVVHLGSIGVAKGDTVAEGAPIGSMGWSGEPEHDVPTVHLGVRVEAQGEGYVDPLGLLPPRATAPAPSPPAAPAQAAATAPAPAAAPVAVPVRASAPVQVSAPTQPAAPAPSVPRASPPISIAPAAPSPQVGGSSVGPSSAPEPTPAATPAAVLPQDDAPSTATRIGGEAPPVQAAPEDAPFRVVSRANTSAPTSPIATAAVGARPTRARGDRLSGTPQRGHASAPAVRATGRSPLETSVDDGGRPAPQADDRSSGEPAGASAGRVVAPLAVGAPHRFGPVGHVAARLDAGGATRQVRPSATAAVPPTDGITFTDVHGGPRRDVLVALGLLALAATAAAMSGLRRIGGDGAVLPHHADLLRQLHAAYRARVHDRRRGRVRTPSATARP